MDENERSHVIELMGLALGQLDKAKVWASIDPQLYQRLHSVHEELEGLRDSLREEVPPTTTR